MELHYGVTLILGFIMSSHQLSP